MTLAYGMDDVMESLGQSHVMRNNSYVERLSCLERGAWKDRQPLIEVAFPVARISAESYKERMSGAGQTLTSLGSYWKGRKPLVMCRATILGLLLPITDAGVEEDIAMFCRLLSMDNRGFMRRGGNKVTAAQALRMGWLSDEQTAIYVDRSGKSPRWMSGMADLAREAVLAGMSYAMKVATFRRAEQVPEAELLELSDWMDVRAYYELPDTPTDFRHFVRMLGLLRFGHHSDDMTTARVCDRFAGGGSIPFEAARMGCEAEASDLNPIACMLNWGNFNIIGGSEEYRARLSAAQARISEALNRFMQPWEVNAQGHRAKAYIYCVETKCADTGWTVPMSPTWVISKTTRTFLRMVPDVVAKRFDLVCVNGATDHEMAQAEKGTVQNGMLVWEVEGIVYRRSIKSIRGDRTTEKGGRVNSLRPWTLDDFMPRPGDTWQERLTCVSRIGDNGRFYYVAPSQADMDDEQRIAAIVRESLTAWQRDGLVPDMKIEIGQKTKDPIRERGWMYWHHFFNARQLMMLAELRRLILVEPDQDIQAGMIVMFCKTIDFMNKDCRWDGNKGSDKTMTLFYNQSFNSVWNYSARSSFVCDIPDYSFKTNEHKVITYDAASEKDGEKDLFITDPPYADSVCYDEITEFFIAWNKNRIPEPFRKLTWDSRRNQAVKGDGEGFLRSLLSAYTQMTREMSSNGRQIVMFTHQDASIWAGVGRVMWTAGLQVINAWCVTTETDSALRTGNNVKGTVLLVLKHREKGSRDGWLSDIRIEVEDEVKRQIDAMHGLDAGGIGDAQGHKIRNFSDADLQLAAYAAALRVLTSYTSIEGQEITEDEVVRKRAKGEKSDFERIIEDAVEVANNHLLPEGIERRTWEGLNREERFYLRGAEAEAMGNLQVSTYQEFARGFGVANHCRLLGSDRANSSRVRRSDEFAGSELGETEFGRGRVRRVLLAAHQLQKERARDEEASVRPVLTGLREGVKDYWKHRDALADIASFLGRSGSPSRRDECEAMKVLSQAIRGDR